MVRHEDPDGADAELFGIDALAKAVNRSPVTVRRWERQGILPRARRRPSKFVTGERRLYRRSDIDALHMAALRTGVLYAEQSPGGFREFSRLAHDVLGDR